MFDPLSFLVLLVGQLLLSTKLKCVCVCVCVCRCVILTGNEAVPGVLEDHLFLEKLLCSSSRRSDE